MCVRYCCCARVGDGFRVAGCGFLFMLGVACGCVVCILFIGIVWCVLVSCWVSLCLYTIIYGNCVVCIYYLLELCGYIIYWNCVVCACVVLGVRVSLYSTLADVLSGACYCSLSLPHPPAHPSASPLLPPPRAYRSRALDPCAVPATFARCSTTPSIRRRAGNITTGSSKVRNAGRII